MKEVCGGFIQKEVHFNITGAGDILLIASDDFPV
jgi:hypothetical protein